jgi:acetyltransferase-like isoleucine patch superfamily enzyme
MSSIFPRVVFRLRHTIWGGLLSTWRKSYFRVLGMRIGRHTWLGRLSVTWPHQVDIGCSCLIEEGVSFKFDGIWCPGPSIVIVDVVFIGRGCEFNIRKQITVGSRTAIASGCQFIDHDHDITGTKLDELPGPEAAIEIGEDVWLGCNVIVLKGVTIGDGAVIAAGAVVTKNIPAGEVWAGIPAKKISSRKERKKAKIIGVSKT